MLTLSTLHVYPIKGTRGTALEEATVYLRGLADDRRWLLVDDAGVFLTQRQDPRLALIHAHVYPSHLTVEAPGCEPLRVFIPHPHQAQRVAVQIWKDEVQALEADAAAHAWFSSYLGRAYRLVYMDEAAVRLVDPQYAVMGREEVSFADGYPLLLTTTASLGAVNDRLVHPVPMNRFRPNLVVTGGEAFAEDEWLQVRIGEVLFHVAKPCARCVVTTINQQTAVQGKEPLRTLTEMRRRNGKVYFGQNLIPATTGVVRRGDPVTVVAWREAVHPVLQ